MTLNTLSIVTSQGQHSLVAKAGQVQIVPVIEPSKFIIADSFGMAPKQIKLQRDANDLLLIDNEQVLFILKDYYQIEDTHSIYGFEDDGQHYIYTVSEDAPVARPIEEYVSASDVATTDQAPLDTITNPISEDTNALHRPWVFTGLASLGLFAGLAALGSNSSDDDTRPPAAKPNNHPATITLLGEAELGETLTAEVQDVDGVPSTLTYQWLADGQPISGASLDSYILTDRDVSKIISVKAHYTDNAGFTESPVSAATNPVIHTSPVNNPATITISEESLAGEEVGNLTATITDADGIADSGITYQWLADGSPIDGANNKTYKLTNAEAGKAVTVQVSYIDNKGFSESVASDPDAAVYIPEPMSDLVVDVTDTKYGATGDGASDDTAAIQQAINEVGQAGGGTVIIPGGTYMIDAEISLRMHDNVTLKMQDDTILQTMTNNAPQYDLILINKVHNAHVIGGTLIGDRDTHTGTNGEWGMGIRILGSQNVVIENVIAKDFWGDGFYVSKNVMISEDILF